MPLNEESIRCLEKNSYRGIFQKPLYSDYAFSLLGSTIEKLLVGHQRVAMADAAVGGEWGPYDVVVTFLIDGFGLEFFNAYQTRLPALQRLYREGVVSGMSSAFPSTTAAHLTSLHTGLEVGQTGIYEWFQYDPLVDEMIAPLLFSLARQGRADSLAYSPSALFPFETVYERWKRQGIRSFALQQEKIASTTYSKAMLRGSEVVPFQRWQEGVEKAALLAKQPFNAPTYIFVYWGDIDGVGHRQGIGSAAFDDAVEQCWHVIEEKFLNVLAGEKRKIAVLFTADHGMVAVDPSKTLFVNELCPALDTMLVKNREGTPLLPAGSCRDFFLHIQPDQLTHAQKLLSCALKGRAEVMSTAELLQEGFFGSLPPSERLKERIGSLVVLPHRDQSVFWKFEGHRFHQHFLAAHGGLTPQEMQSVLMFLPIE